MPCQPYKPQDEAEESDEASWTPEDDDKDGNGK